MINSARRDEYLAELSKTNQPDQNKPNIMPAANPLPVPAAMPNVVPGPAQASNLTPDELPTVQLTALMGNVQVGGNQVSVDNAGGWTPADLARAQGVFKFIPKPGNNDPTPLEESFFPSTEPK